MRKGTAGIVASVLVFPGRPSAMPWMGQLIETCCFCGRGRGVAVEDQFAEQENDHRSFTPLERGNTPTDATRAGTEIESSSSKKAAGSSGQFATSPSHGWWVGGVERGAEQPPISSHFLRAP